MKLYSKSIFNRLLWLGLIVLSLNACNEEQLRKDMQILASSTGSIDEVLVIMPDVLWEGACGTALTDVLEQDVLGIPQPEPLFRLIHLNARGFVKHLMRHNNILIVGTLDQQNKTASMIQQELQRLKSVGKHPKNFFLKRDVWASPQRVFYFFAKNPDALIQNITTHQQKLIQALQQMGSKQAKANIYIPGINEGLTEVMRKDFKLDFAIPNKFKVVEQHPDRIWLRQDDNRAESIMNIIVQSIPYENEAPLLSEDLPITWRDALGKHISSQIEGSYLVSDPVLPFEQKMLTIAGQQGIETRGLWRMKNDFMGGPFLNYCFNDTNNKRTVMLDAFVYAPKKKKHPYMRKLTALLKTVKLSF